MKSEKEEIVELRNEDKLKDYSKAFTLNNGRNGKIFRTTEFVNIQTSAGLKK